MGRTSKLNANQYVTAENNSAIEVAQLHTRNFAITLTGKEWILIDFLVGSRSIPALESHLNKAVATYLENLSQGFSSSKKVAVKTDSKSGSIDIVKKKDAA